MLDVSIVTQVADGYNIELENEILSRHTSNERHIAIYSRFVNTLIFPSDDGEMVGRILKL